MAEVFDSYSKYYDLLYRDKDYNAEAEYISKLLGDVKTVFEMGCGTGKHAKLLTQKGYQMFGIDLSETMLSQAKLLGIDCSLGDVRTFRANRMFDAVVSLFHVASYQTSDNDINSYFETARLHLNKGGKFIFDVWHKDAVLAQNPEKRVKVLENNDVKVIRHCVPVHYIEKDVVEVNYTIEVFDKLSGKSEIIKEVHPMRYFSHDDIEKFSNANGFKILKSEEWLTGNNPSKNTWGVCYICEAI